MKNLFKKPIAVILAVLIALGSLTVAIAAINDGYKRTMEYTFKFFDEDGNETTKVSNGQTVYARLYMATDFVAAAHDIFILYDKTFFEANYEEDAETVMTSSNEISYDLSQREGSIYIDSDADDTPYTRLVSENYIPASATATYGGIYLSSDGGIAQKFTYDNFAYQFSFTVIGNTPDVAGHVFIPYGARRSTQSSYRACTFFARQMDDSMSGVAYTEADAQSSLFWDAFPEEEYNVFLIDSKIDESSLAIAAQQGYTDEQIAAYSQFVFDNETYYSSYVTVADLVYVNYYVPLYSDDYGEGDEMFVTWKEAYAYQTGTGSRRVWNYDQTAPDQVTAFMGTVPPAPTTYGVLQDIPENYYFAGWSVYPNAETGGAFDPSTAPLTYMTTAPAITDTVEGIGYDYSDSQNQRNQIPPAEVDTLIADPTIPVMKALTEANYGTAIYNGVDGLTLDLIAVILPVPTEDVTVTWNAKDLNDNDIDLSAYTYTFAPGTEIANTTYPVPTVAAVTGYEFVWYTDDQYTTEADFSDPVAINANTAYYGRYELQSYKLTVNYIDADGEAIDGVDPVVYDGDDAIAYNTEIRNLVDIKTIPHYTFNAAASSEIPQTMPNSELTIYLVYDLNENDLTYYAKEDATGEPVQEFTVAYGDLIEDNMPAAASNPTKDNYEFKGWKFSYTDPDTGDTVTFNSTDDGFDAMTMPDADVTATPLFEVIKKNVTYKYVDDNGNTIREDNVVNDVEAGSTVVVPDAPAIDYYTIADDGKPADFTMPTTDVEKTYVYNRNSYNVTYEYKYGSETLTPDEPIDPNPAQVKWDDPVNAPAAPAITGYGYQSTTYSQELTEGKMPKNDITVTYNYAPNTYTVTYKYVDGDGNAIKDADGNDIPATTVENVAFGTHVTPDTAPEYTGYTISESPVAFDMPDEAVEKSYVYTLNNWTLKFVIDGTEKVNATKAWNTAITEEPDTTAPEGKKFKGWYDNAECTGDPVAVAAKMPDSDLTYYGKFVNKTYKLTVNYVDAEGNAIDGVEPVVFEGDNAVEFGATLADIVEIKTIPHYTNDEDETNIPTTMPAAETTVNVVYNINTNSITYYSTEDATGDPLDVLTEIPYGGEIEITSEDEPTKDGYDFAGWQFSYTDPDTGDTVTFNSEDSDFDTRTMPDAAVTAVPTYTEHQYTLTIYDGDNSVITTKQIAYGVNITIPDDVTVTAPAGYHFTDAWEFYKEGETAAYTESTMPAANVDAIPVCDANSYTIKFVTNVDGYTISDITAAYGADITAPVVDESQNPGFAFAGWYEDEACETTPFTTPFPATMPNLGENNAVKTLYAKWRNADTTFTINVYTMDTEGVYGAAEVKQGSGVNGETLTRAQLLTQAAVTVGEGFEINETTTLAEFQVPAQDGVYNIYIDRVKANYTIDLAGGTLTGDYTPSGEYYYGAAITAPTADPVKDGNYDFDGWDKAFPATMPADDVTVTAQYKHYTEFYFDEPGTTEPVKKYDGEFFNKDTYNGDVDDGYTFKGWSTTEGDVPANAVTSFTAAADVDSVTYYPVFEAGEFTITYKLLPDGVTDATAQWADGTVGDIVATFAVDAAITGIPTGMKRTGYKTEAGTEWIGSAMTVPDVMPAENLVFYVNWIAEEYTITYFWKDADGNYTQSEVFDEIEFGTSYDEWDYAADPEAPEGYELAVDPWNTDQNGNGQTPEQIGTMPADNLVFYAQYNILSFNFRAYYVDSDSNEVDIVNTDIEYGQPTNKDTLSAPDRTAEGYVFVEWSPALDTVPATMPADDIEIQAVYEKIKNTVTYKYVLDSDNNVEIADPVEVPDVEYGTTVTPDAAPEITGYTSVSVPDAFVMGADAITKYYTYNPAEYTVTYKYVDEDNNALLDADGNAIADATAQKAFKADVDTTAPAFDGYEYKSTAIDPALGENSTMPASNVTVTYTYKKLSFTLTYVIDEQDATNVPAAAQVPYMTSVTAPTPAPSLTGSTFIAWYIDEGRNTEATFPFNMPAENVTLYGKFGTDQIVLTFKDGTTFEPVFDDFTRNGEYNATIDPAVVAPEKEGYQFKGWFDNAELNGSAVEVTKFPAASATFWAKYEPNQHNVTYIVDGNPVFDAQVEFGGDVAATKPATDPAKTGYQFTGWKDADGHAPDYYAAMPDKDLEFVAQFTSLNVYVEYIVDGETVSLIPVPYSNGSVTLKTVDGVQTWHYNAENGTEYAPGATYTFTEDDIDGIKFYGVYEETGTVTATFDANGGYFDNDPTATDPKEVETDKGTAPVAPADPKKEGYDFMGWTPAVGTITEDTTYTAVWEAKDARVVFYDEDGTTVIETFDQKYGEEIETPADPEKEGYTFVEWAYTDSNNDPYTGTTVPEGGLNATPIYEINKYQFTVDPAEGTITGTDPSGEKEYNADIAVPEVTREGYSLDADKPWTYYKVVDGVETELTAAPSKMPAYDVKAVANWVANTYSIFLYYTENGEEKEITTITQAYDTEIAPVDDPNNREGYTFTAWSEAIPARMGAYDEPDYQNNTKKIEALYSVISYTLTVNLDEGEFAEGVTNPAGTYAYGAEFPQMPEPTKTGYGFDHWAFTNDEDPTGTEISRPATMPAYNVTATAIWGVQKYDFIVDLNGGSLAQGAEMPENRIEYDNAVPTLPEVVPADGYEFTGWQYFEIINGVESEIASLPAQMPDHGLKAVAKYEKKDITLTFKDGNTVIETRTGKFEDAVDPAVADATKTGYTFKGWYDNEGLTGDPVAAPTAYPAADATYFAKFEINTYNIVLYYIDEDNHEQEITTITKEYGATIDPVDDPVREGYTFTGWEEAIPATMPAYDAPDYADNTKVIEAFFSVNKYQFTVDPDCGTITGTDPSDEYEYGANVPAVPEVTKEGYKLNATTPWIYYKVENGVQGDEIAAPTTMPAYDVKAKANWVVQKYQFTVDAADGTITGTDPSGEYEYGADVPAVPEVTREGYELNATTPWIYYKVENGVQGDEIAAPTTMPAYDVKAEAQWDVKQFNLTVDLDGGNFAAGVTDPSGDYDFGAAFPTLPSNADDVVKTDSTFSGWKYYKVENGVQGDEISKPDTMPAYDVKAVAQYGDVLYTITFDSQGGSDVAAIEAKHGDPITAPADPTKGGYTFKGWYTDAACTDGNEYTVPPTMPGESKTVYAKWTAIAKLIAKDGTTTMVQRGSIVESYQIPDQKVAGVEQIIGVDKVNYNYANDDCVDFYIYGLKTGISADGGLDSWVEVTGDGTYEVDMDTVGATGKVGTGTVVNVYDADHELVETFKIIIFGDIDGNGRITNADTSALNNELTEPRVWSVDTNAEYDICRVKAADLDQNGNVSTDDYVAITDYMRRKVDINKVTGRYE